MAMRLCSLLLLVAILVGAAQEPLPKRCKPCGSTGLIACADSVHAKQDLLLERDGILGYCSHVSPCGTCGGVGLLPCERCQREEVRADLERRKERWRAGRELHAVLEKDLGRALPGGVSEHYHLLFDLESMKVGKQRLNQHELLHLFAARVEALFARYLEVLKVSPSEIPDRSTMAVWWLAKDHKDASTRYCGGQGSMGVKRMGPNPWFSTCGDKSHFPDDDDLHRYLIHNATHLVLSNHTPPEWMGRYKGGAWFDEGLASWFETDLAKSASTWCFQEQDARGSWGNGRWRLEIRKLVQGGEAPGLAQVMARDVNALEMVEQATAFSVIDYLIQRDASRLTALGRALKAKQPARDALKEVYGLSILELETLWQAFVLETYPTH